MTKFGMGTQILTQATEMWENSRNSTIQYGGRTPYWNHFLAITRLHRVLRLRRNFEFGGIIARTRKLDDENVEFRKSNMADGRHFENHYISTSQPQIVRISRNLVCRHKYLSRESFEYWARRQKHEKNPEIPKFKMADGRHIEIIFWL